MSGISHVRSLIKRNFNLYILAGSPLSIRVDAPFKMGIAAAPGSTSVLDSPMDDQERIDRNGGRRFAKRGSKQAEEEEEDNAQNSQPLIPDTPGQGNFIPGNQMFQSGGQQQQGGFQGGGQPAGGGGFQGGNGQAPATMPSGAGQDGQKAPGTDF